MRFAYILTFAALAACKPAVTPVTSDSAAVEQRALEARANAPEVKDAKLGELMPNGVTRAYYLCENGEELTVDFDRKRGLATVRKSDGLALDLPAVPATSGFVYRSGTVELRGMGSTAEWTSLRLPKTPCRAVN